MIGKISELKINQLVGIYSQKFDQWILGRVQNVVDGEVIVSAEGSNSVLKFGRSGETIYPENMRDSYSLVHAERIPGHIRFADTRTIVNYLSHRYAEYRMSIASDE